MSRTLCALILGAMLAILPGCGPKVTPAIPQGFAPYKGERLPFRAVSPDGIVYRVRAEENKPKADLPFWNEALKKRMIDAGYHFMSESDIKADGRAGYLLELSAPVGNQDYTYLVALFDNDKHLVIVETAGEVTRFKARRDSVVSAIERIRF